MLTRLIDFIVKKISRADAVKTGEKNTDSRAAYIKLAGGAGLFFNLLLFALKLFIGIVSNSVSITADAVNNLTDLISTLVSMIGFRIASKPADSQHPYGHARFEYISGLIISAFMFAVGFEFASASMQKIISPESTVFSYAMLAVLLLSILIKFLMGRFYTVIGKRIDSESLKASAQDSLNDVVTTSVVLLAMLAEKFFALKIDGYAGLAVAVWIIYGTYGIAKETVSRLLGESPDPELASNLVKYIEGFDARILGTHDLLLHDYGPGKRFASVHLEMDAKEDALKAHELIDDIERAVLKKYNINTVIHFDPVITDNPEQNKVCVLIKDRLAEIDPRIKIHDFRLDRRGEIPAAVFDCALPDDLFADENKITAVLKEELEKSSYHFNLDITFDVQTLSHSDAPAK